MTVGAEGKKASLENALSRCERFRLPPKVARQILSVLQKGVAAWRDHFRACGVREDEIAMLENSFAAKP